MPVLITIAAYLRDVSDENKTLYLPGSGFMLVGKTPGSYAVAATHALSGMTAQQQVSVDNLYTKLVYIQVYPAISCNINYRNGDGKPMNIDITDMIKTRLGTSVLPGQTLKLYLVVSRTDGSRQYVFSRPITIYNLIDIPSLITMAQGNGALTALKNTVIQSINMLSQPGDQGDGEIKAVLGYLMGSTVGLEVNETENPLVYEATFRMAIGSYKSSKPSGVFVGSGAEQSLSYTPGVSDIKAMTKRSFVQKSLSKMNKSNFGTQKIYSGGAFIEGSCGLHAGASCGRACWCENRRSHHRLNRTWQSLYLRRYARQPGRFFDRQNGDHHNRPGRKVQADKRAASPCG